MASLPRGRRHRSSTTRSNALPLDPQASTLDSVLRRLSNKPHGIIDAAVSHGEETEEILRILTSAPELDIVQDHFRRLHGFQKLLAFCSCPLGLNQDVQLTPAQIETACQSFVKVTEILSVVFRNHEGNRRYFTRRVGEGGWKSLQDTALQLQTRAVQSVEFDAALDASCTLCGALLALILDDTALQNLLGPNLTDPSIALTLPSVTNDEERTPEAGEALGEQQHKVSNELDEVLSKHDGDLASPEALVIVLVLYSITPTHATDKRWHPFRLLLLHCIKAVTDRTPRTLAAVHTTALVPLLLTRLLESSVERSELEILTAIVTQLLSQGVTSLEDAALLLKKAAINDQARKLLRNIVSQSKEPPCVQFDLAQHGHSSIELANMPRGFPPHDGYSLTAWVRFDELDPGCHTTIFGAFDASQTCFVLVYLERDTQQLILQTSVTSPRPSTRFKKTSFSSGIWYHLVLVQRPKKSSTPSKAALFVDGRHIEVKECVYPQAPPAMQNGTHASPFPPEPTKQRPVQAFFGTPQDLSPQAAGKVRSRWSLANAHLYDCCIPSETIAVHHGLGPSYSGNFQDQIGQLLTYRASAELNYFNEWQNPDTPEKSALVSAIQRPGSDLIPESSILISISANTAVNLEQSIEMLPLLTEKAGQSLHTLMKHGNQIMFNAARPLIGDALTRSHGTAVITGQPVVKTPRHIDDATWRVSGSLAVHMRLVETATTGDALLDATSTLLDCIQHNWRISEVMEKENGYGVIALLLREKLGTENASSRGRPGRTPLISRTQDKSQLRMDLLNLVLTFVGFNKDKPHESLLINPMAYRVFLLDFDTWRTGDVETQDAYYRQFCSFLSNGPRHAFNTRRFTKMRIVRRCLDSLRTDVIHKACLPTVLSAVKALFSASATHANYRDLASFIAYALQEGRAPGNSQSHRRGTTTSRVSGRNSPMSVLARKRSVQLLGLSMTAETITAEDLGVSILQSYAELLCDGPSASQLRKFIRHVPGRVSSDSDHLVFSRC